MQIDHTCTEASCIRRPGQIDFYQSIFDALLMVLRSFRRERNPEFIPPPPPSPLALGCFRELKSKAGQVWQRRACECLGPLPAGLDTISSGDTLRLCLPCNLFCLSIWWMSCLPALPHTLENGGSRTLLKELQKGRQEAFVFCKEGDFFFCEHECMCVCMCYWARATMSWLRATPDAG